METCCTVSNIDTIRHDVRGLVTWRKKDKNSKSNDLDEDDGEYYFVMEIFDALNIRLSRPGVNAPCERTLHVNSHYFTVSSLKRMRMVVKMFRSILQLSVYV
jgi:hypothetical protein